MAEKRTREGLGTRPAHNGKTENVELADITATMIVPAYAQGPLIWQRRSRHRQEECER